LFAASGGGTKGRNPNCFVGKREGGGGTTSREKTVANSRSHGCFQVNKSEGEGDKKTAVAVKKAKGGEGERR